MSYCPFKFGRFIRGEVLLKKLTPVDEFWECEGTDCEWFNPNYGRCCRYVESLTIDERVELEKKNGKKI